jgi:hypothetical protein
VAKAKTKAPKPGTEPEDDLKIPEQERDAVAKLLSEIERAKTLTKDFRETTLPKLRRLSWGTSISAEQRTSVRTNLIYATQATLLPHIYAKNPEIAVTPTEAVGEEEYAKTKRFSKTAQAALNRMFVEEPKLKARAKANVRSTMNTSVGWLKLTLQSSLEGDPLTLARIADIQDNLNRIEHLVRESKHTVDPHELNRQREELKLQYKTILDGKEVKLAKGFVIDRVKTEDIFILDESIREFDDYVHAKKLAHRVWMTDDDYKQRFKRKVDKTASVYGQPASGEAVDESGAKIEINTNNEDRNTYRAVYEVWDRTTNMVSVVCEGCKGYSKAPRSMEWSSERWYPFFALAFNVVEGRWRPLSDVELLQHLQDEYNTTRHLYAEARKEAIPTRLFRKSGGLTEEDIANLKDRRARDWIGVEGNPTMPLKDEILQLDGITIDPAAYDVTLIRNDMDMMVGLSDASRSNLIQAKTATEAEIMRQSLMTRVAERQDSAEDMVSEMATACLQIMLQAFSKAEIQELVGEGADWPEEADIETIFRQIRVSVKAGTTGRPNQVKERESWAQIMPIINETITQVAELRAAGHPDMANAKIELLKETLLRYDEKIDVDRFVPRDQGQGNAQAEMAQQMAKLQQDMAALQEEHTKMQEEYQKCQQERDAAVRGEQSKIAESETKRAIETARAESDIQIQANRDAINARNDIMKHRMSLDSQERVAGLKTDSAETIAYDKHLADVLKASEKAERDAQTARETARVNAKAKVDAVKAKPPAAPHTSSAAPATAAPAEPPAAAEEAQPDAESIASPELLALLKDMKAKVDELAEKTEPMVIMGGDGLPVKVRTPEGDLVVALDEQGLPTELVPEPEKG